MVNELMKLTIGVMVAVMLMATCAGAMDGSSDTHRELLTLYIKQSNPTLAATVRHLIAEEVVLQSYNRGIPWEITAAIMKIESCYNPKAVGPMGEIGLMQIYTMHCAGASFDPLYLEDIKYNINAGLCIFCDKLRIVGGDVCLAIERYNGTGPGAIQFRTKVIQVIMELFRTRVTHNRRRRTKDALAIN